LVCGLFCCAKEGERLRFYEDSRSPIAHLAVITDANNLVLIVVTNHREAVDWVLMAICSKTTFLDRLRPVLTFSIA